MPNLADIPVQSLLIACALAVVLTGLGGWLYASRPPMRRARAVRPARVFREQDDPTQPIMRTAVINEVSRPRTTRRRRWTANRVAFRARPRRALS